MSESYAVDRCDDILLSTAPSFGSAYSWSERELTIARSIILEGSLNISRTVSNGRQFFAAKGVADHQVSGIAEQNFARAVEYVLQNYHDLQINLTTATELNRILTERLVPEEIRGNFNFRPKGDYTVRLDPLVSQKTPSAFYRWLDSPEAYRFMRQDPLRFAEVIHHSMVALDSFPDGNGRLSRLFADLVLIKNGFAPAFYTSMQDYFARGSARSEVSREQRAAYFYEIVRRGQREMSQRSLVNAR